MHIVNVKAVEALFNCLTYEVVLCVCCLQVGKFHKENDNPSLASPP